MLRAGEGPVSARGRILLCAVLLAGCIDNGVGVHAPTDLRLTLVLPPATPAAWYPRGESLHVAVRRAGRAEPIAELTTLIGDSLAATVTVPLEQSVERFVATAEVWIGGQIYFLGFDAVQLRAASDTAVTLTAIYVGPGGAATSLALALRDSTLRRGDTTSVLPDARDSLGRSIANPPTRYVSQRPALVSVDAPGLITALPAAPDTARVTGYLPTGPSGSVLVRVVPGAAALALVSGDGQTGLASAPLGDSLKVRVLDDGGVGLAGEPVSFAADPGDGALSPATVVSDVSGYAAARWTLGGHSGTHGAAATVAGVAPARFSATVLGVDSVAVSPAAATLTLFGALQSFTAAAFDAAGQPVPGQSFVWSSSDTTVATVDANGLAVAIAHGTTTITATTGGVSGTATLTVSIASGLPNLDTRIRVLPDSPLVADTALIVAVVRNGGSAAAAATRAWLRVYWTPEDAAEELAIDTGFAVPALAAGDSAAFSLEVRDVVEDHYRAVLVADTGAVVTESDETDNMTDGFVYPRYLVVVTPGAATITVPFGTRQFVATATDGNGQSVPCCSWESSEPLVATVDQNGFTQADSNGTTTITAGGIGRGSASATLTVAAPPLVFTQVVAGVSHSCGVTADSTAYCWGYGGQGQLGVGGLVGGTPRPTPVLTALKFATLAAGDYHTCGLTAAGAAYCWGNNVNGQLGNGNAFLRTVPDAVSGGLSFVALTANYGRTCGLTAAGQAYCWGENSVGTLGDSSTIERHAPVRVVGGHTFASISAGFAQTCAVTPAAAAYCWGGGFNGELGTGGQASDSAPVAVSGGLSFTSVSAGYGHTCGVTTTGAGYCWGDNSSEGVLGDGTAFTIRLTPVPVAGGLVFASIASGYSHTCGVTTVGAGYCWGDNVVGTLGDGSGVDPSLMPVAVVGGLVFRSVVLGSLHALGVTTGNVAYGWGWNGNGELGDRTQASRPTPVRVAGQAP